MLTGSMRLVLVSSLALLGTAAASCAQSDDYGDVCESSLASPALQDSVEPDGDDYPYVIDSIAVPRTDTDVNIYGVNLDGDDQGRPDNRLGAVLVRLAEASAALDFQDAATTGIARGDAITLVNVQTTSITMATRVGVSMYQGTNPSVTPCADADDTECGRHLHGNTSFEIAPGTPTSSLVVGNVLGGQFAGGPGVMEVAISLLPGAAPVELALVGARVEIRETSETELASGVLAGALTGASLLTVVAALTNAVIELACVDPPTADAPCGCPTPEISQLVAALDRPGSQCRVYESEISVDDLADTFLAPDVDLFDDNGWFYPRKDGLEDSVSFGVGFTAVGAAFDRPPPGCP